MQQKASRVHNIDHEIILITFQVFAERTMSHIYIFEMIKLFLLKENKFRLNKEMDGKLQDV